ncbi:HNH endonuclease [Rhizobium rhizogenes]|uniref:HNH endonuclease n=1 Tax=Rhizobium rhizogenes TaxID=359 RepID=UPI0035ABA793
MRRKDRNKKLDFTTDHKIPLCRGGPDTRENKVPCCFRCNNLKGDMTANEFFLYINKFGFERQSSWVKEKMKYELQYPKI